MKKFLALLLAVSACGVFASPASAKTVNATSFRPWIGSWTCVSGKDKFSETFTPILNGKAMRVAVTGPYASEGIAVYDKTRKAWFYAFISGDGTYSANTGPVSGANIAFKQVFPPGVAVDNITLTSPARYTSSFTMIVNNKNALVNQVCTKS